MKKLGIIGSRGMVGSVLLQRMQEENDFERFNTYFFSTSQAGKEAPVFINSHKFLLDAYRLEQLSEMDIILSCQGGDFTQKIHAPLRNSGWKGYWIDAASTLRMNDQAVIVLDPVNKDHITKAIESGTKDFIGGNCTVSLMLMGLGGLFKENLVEWMTSMSYQAASGAGAKNMTELLDQMNFNSKRYEQLKNKSSSLKALEIEKEVSQSFYDAAFPQTHFQNALNLNLIPWIDKKMDNGQSKEEWKAQVEANKILATDQVIPIDGTCVRIGALRCHSQAFTIKLKKSVDLSTLEQIIGTHNDWVDVVDNNKEQTIEKLTPKAIGGSLNIAVGRLRKMTLGDQFINAFSVGDQLLWGAAEPIRRMLSFID